MTRPGGRSRDRGRPPAQVSNNLSWAVPILYRQSGSSAIRTPGSGRLSPVAPVIGRLAGAPSLPSVLGLLGEADGASVDRPSAAPASASASFAAAALAVPIAGTPAVAVDAA